MKRAEIKTAVDRHLNALGFSRGSWLWQQGGSLIVIVDGQIKSLKLKSGMSKRELTFNLGIMFGWASMAGIEPRRPETKPAPSPRKMNGHSHRAGRTSLEIPAQLAG